MKRGTAAIMVAVITLLASPAAPAQDDRLHGEFARVVSVGERPTLELRNPNGSTIVRAGATSQVRVDAVISAGTRWDCDAAESRAKVELFEERHAMTVEGERVRIGNWEHPRMKHCTQLNYEVSVPAGTTVVIEQGYGSVKVYGVAGAIDVEVDVGGSVRIKDPGGRLTIRSGVGAIAVDGRPRDDWRLEAGLGSVELRVPRAAGFELDAEADEGTVESELPTSSGGGVEVGGGARSMRGPVNGGGPMVRLRTETGGIEIFER